MKISTIVIGMLMATIPDTFNASVVSSAEKLLGLDSGGALYTIDQKTAATTLLNTTGYGTCVAMAYDASTDRLYGVCGSTLIQIDPNDGKVSTAVSIDLSELTAEATQQFSDRQLVGDFEKIDIAFDSDGVLYGYLSGPHFQNPSPTRIAYVEAIGKIDLNSGKVDSAGSNCIFSRGSNSDALSSFNHAIAFRTPKTFIHAIRSTGPACPSDRNECLEEIDLTSCSHSPLFSFFSNPIIDRMSSVRADNTLFVSSRLPDQLDTLDLTTQQLNSIGSTVPLGGIALVACVTDCGGGEEKRVNLTSSQVSFPFPSSFTTTTGPQSVRTSTVGDGDNFHSGDLADRLSESLGNQSSNVVEILKSFTAKNLDEEVNNEAVGFTHFVTLPAQPQIKDATVTFTIKGTGDNVGNDTILYNESQFNNNPPPGAFPGFVPFIALQDVLDQNVIGDPSPDKVLQPNKVYTLRIDLSRVPVRLSDTAGPGGSFSGSPDGFRDFTQPDGLLASQGRFDMVFSDDTAVDGSILRLALLGQPEGCPSGSAGLVSFTTTLTNNFTETLDDVRIVVNNQTSPGVQLLLPNNDLVSPSSEVSLTNLVPGHTGTLEQGQSVAVPFDLCIPTLTPFKFFVDVNTLVPAQ